MGGGASIREINKITGWHLPTDGPKTLNGLVLEILEEIPEGNVCFQLGNQRFESLALADKRVKEVRGWRFRGPTTKHDEDEEED